jgi:pimeloyl-ACP methyl ester carboxylesterase
VLVGHSIGGAELSSIATRKPERVAGVVYLDAGYAYAFDDGNGVSFQEMTDRLVPSPPPPPTAADVESFAALREWYRRGNDITFPEAEWRMGSTPSTDGRPGQQRASPGNAAVLAGIRKYSAIRAPALAIFAVPHNRGAWAAAGTGPDAREKADELAAADLDMTTRQANAFERGVPGARVVRLAGAHHYVFLSNEADVLREIRSFVAGLR